MNVCSLMLCYSLPESIKSNKNTRTHENLARLDRASKNKMERTLFNK